MLGPKHLSTRSYSWWLMLFEGIDLLDSPQQPSTDYLTLDSDFVFSEESAFTFTQRYDMLS